MHRSHTAKLAKISYRLRLGRTDSESISLGALVHFYLTPEAEILVIICLAKLEDAQRAELGMVAQRRLAAPAEFFNAEIDTAIKAKVPDLFAHLAEKFRWSLEVAHPVEVAMPEGFVVVLKRAFTNLRRKEAAATRKALLPGLVYDDIKVVRPAKPAAAALARIAGPEFSSDSLVAVVPPA